MKISLINGSQKPGGSNSGVLLGELNSLLSERNDVTTFASRGKSFSGEEYDRIIGSDVIVLGFPLYVDSIPSNTLKILIELEGLLKEADHQNIAFYAIINNGFFEGEQTRVAFEITRNFCERAGVIFGGGIGEGAGEMLGSVKKDSVRERLFKKLWVALKSLAEKIEQKAPFEIRYLSPSFPKFLWRFMAKHTFWNKLARKNNLNKKDILRKLS